MGFFDDLLHVRPAHPGQADQYVQINRMSTPELIERMGEDKPYVLVDARSFELYDKCHMPGAVSIMENEVEIYAGKYDRDTDVIVYGSTHYCRESTMTAVRFAEMGFTHVYDYGDGMLEWLLKDQPTECTF